MPSTRLSPEMRVKARSLRHNLTKGEVFLWLELRNLKRIGLHFRKQSAIGPYVVDFACLAAKLIVEVDGDLHEMPARREHDRNRDDYLRSKGFHIMRLDYPDVVANAWHAASVVREVALGRLDPTRPLRGHPPLFGEG